MHLMRILSSIRPAVLRLRDDTRALAMLEFAFATPLVLTVGLFALEAANLALANMRVSQIALNLADNAARVGVESSLSTQQLREVDIVEVMDAVRNQGAKIGLLENGRVTLSSLEDTANVQRIHWQRCIGKAKGNNYDSSYGTTKPSDGIDQNMANQGTPAPLGMGEPTARVNAPLDSGVMFVEINYNYQPIVGAWIYGNPRIRYTASFIVRDRRDFRQIYNPSPAATRLTCDKYTA